MKFKHSDTFNHHFSQIDGIRFYPYVGKKFDKQNKRIMIFAHNIYCEADKYEAEQIRTKSPTHFADAMEEYTYTQGWWTKAWRFFLKGSLNLSTNFSLSSDKETVSKINNFVEKISYTNYINDLVKSDKATNINIDKQLIDKSNIINKKLIDILNITHCICWGAKTFNHLKGIKEYNVIDNLKYSKKGFEYAKIENTENKKTIHVLRIFHPSMPSFGVYNKDTHKILNEFYTKE